MAPKKVAQFKQRDEAVPVEELEEPEGAGGVPQMNDESRQLTLQDLAVMFRKNMEFQQRQETQMEQEAARQEQRWKMLQHQFNLLREEVDARTNPDLPSEMRGNVSNASVAHARNPVPVPLLTGKARSAYVHMDIEETLDYDQIKSAILSKYAINPETYRQRFRSLEIEPDETPKELYVRLKELYEKWVQPKGKTVEAVAEVIILEQYSRMLSPELQVWVREHNPSSAVEAASLADVFVAARSRSQVWGAAQRGNRDNKSLPTFGRGEGKFNSGSKKSKGSDAQFSRPPPQSSQVPICYYCGQEGHKKPMCPKLLVKSSQICSVPTEKLTLPQNLTVPVEVNGKKVKALIDTGSMQTLVESQLVPKQANANNGKVVIRCVHGEEQIYPTLEVQVVVQEQPYLLKVAVVEKLPYPVILGQDFPLLFNLLPFNSACSMVMTRAQAMQSMDESETLKSFPFFDAELEAGPVKVRKSRRQRRQEKYRYRDAEGQEQGGKLDEFIGYKIPSNMAELQQTDPVLSPLYQRAILTSQEEGGNAVEDRVVERFVLQEKVLYRQQGDGFQMVVPKAVQNIVLSLGHSIPWAGHLGRQKTLARIKRHFYWPGLRADVVKFCKTCPECQLTSNRLPSKAPLQPLPVMGVPFERLAMDIVGPVEKSRAGHRFMLVVSDYATKYPEDFPLGTIGAKQVATCLIELFSRASTGFSPFELLYGHNVRGPLSLLKENWAGVKEEGEEQDVASFVVAMHEKLQRMTNLAQEHMAEAQQKQKSWYDKSARTRSFVPGQQVLVMLPTVSSKLLAKWQGPFEILQKLGPTTYEISTPGQAHSKRILHVNLLKEWSPRKECLLIRSVEDEEEVEEQYFPGLNSAGLKVDHLPEFQQQQLQSLCNPELFQAKPGQTKLVEHDIVLKEDAVPKRLSYRIPERLLPALKKELDLMISLGVIEPSKISKFDSYPMPRIEELIERLGNAKYLSTVDLCKGYWQVPLSSSSKELIAFRTPWGLHHFKTMPFGLHGAPPTFQRLMDQVLHGLSDFMSAYLDDIVIFSETWEEHLKHLQMVLRRIQEAGLTINPDKCALAKKEIEYLGYVVGNGVIWPQVGKVQAIKSFTLPKTKKQMDASGVGLGAVLLQGEVGNYHPVAYISRKLFPREMRYSTIEKECLAVKWALDSLRYYLLGRHFTLETDHRALQWLNNMKDTNARITCWYLSLQPYRFTILHRPGRENLTADFLSRHVGEEPEVGESVTGALLTSH
ncbi:gag-pol fusion protein [Pimephales promelas]|nr:gag-pol fusion protein [Pimephales promelas]